MFRLIKGNVERIAETEFQRNKLLNLGYSYMRIGNTKTSDDLKNNDIYPNNTKTSDDMENNDTVLEEMTVERLKAIAKENNISGYGGMNKSALIESIRKLGQE